MLEIFFYLYMKKKYIIKKDLRIDLFYFINNDENNYIKDMFINY